MILGTDFQHIDPSLLDSDEWLRLLLETLPHMAWVIVPGGQAAYYNQRFADYLGFRPGSDRRSRTALHHPEDRARLEAARAEGVRAGKEYVVESRVRRHDGAWLWHRVHNIPLTRDGRVVAWLGTSVDIHDVVESNAALERRVRERTAELEQSNRALAEEIERRWRMERELRDSEARYRTLYNRTPVALQSVDAETHLIEVNETWTEMFGYTREEALGRSPTDFMTPEAAEIYRTRAWPEMLESNGQVRTEDYQFVTRSGRVFDGRLAARGEFDAAGRFVRSWSAISDISAEKRTARELRQAQRTETMGQLTAGIAHDFNNLLTAIMGNLELLAKPSRDAERFERLLAGARSAAERGARLTAQLLAFSRQQRIVTQPLDLKPLIADMLPLLRSTIGATIRIDVAVDRALWDALADPTQLELAVVNLAINARDAMATEGATGGTIAITARNVCRGEPDRPEEPGPGDYVEIAVADTGPGIPDSVRERIFDPFFTTKEAGKGSGLGLPQVLGVAKQIGRGVEVRSEAGTGTRVAIYLPRADAAADAGPDAPDAELATDPAPEQHTTLLVVDDDPAVRATTADMLRDHGYGVVEADSASTALRLLDLDECRPALLLVDVAMPGMTGVELAETVARARPDLPILFMTGYAGSELLPNGAARDVVSKPFQAADLAAKVARAIGRRQMASDPG